MRGEKYCRVSCLQDSSTTNETLALLFFSAVVGGALVYEGILILMNENSFPLKNLFLNLLVLLIGQSLFLFIIELKRKPIVTEYGLSIPLNMAKPESRERSGLRVIIPWEDVEKIVIDSKTVDGWEVKFLLMAGPEIRITSQMGYDEKCVDNLVKLAERRKIEIVQNFKPSSSNH